MPEDRFDAAKGLFIRRWGEMAASWGISRTMAEIHALLYLAAQPLCTDDVMRSARSWRVAGVLAKADALPSHWRDAG